MHVGEYLASTSINIFLLLKDFLFTYQMKIISFMMLMPICLNFFLMKMYEKLCSLNGLSLTNCIHMQDT
uniref:Uncharacterized protein n=1 Tax=Arundo donax TaxID=35708 RepID=A0A0A9B3V5_ARUDO